MKTLFKNALILTKVESQYKVLNNAYLGVDGDKITYLSETKPNDNYDVIKDMKNKLLMPGLVNSHGHAPMTLTRGLGSGLKLQSWLYDCIFPIEAKLTPNDIYIGAKLAAIEMIRSGTTTYSEMYDFPYAEAKAVAESGLRSNLCRTGLCFDPDIEMKDWLRYEETTKVALNLNGKYVHVDEIKKELGTEELPQVIKDAIEDGRIRGDLSFHSQYLTTPKFVDAITEFNKEHNFNIQVHVDENKKEHEDGLNAFGVTPLRYFYDHHVLEGGNVYAAHCVKCTDEDFDLMAKTGTSMVTNPSSNLKLGSGVARIKDAMNHGVNVALGTDGCASNNNLDMFEEMHILSLVQPGFYEDPTVLKPEDILDMATINGAKAMHRNDIGKLEVGYKADIIAINLDAPHMIPNLDLLSLLVYSVKSSDVTMNMVNGKILYEDGKFYTLDYEKVKKEIQSVIDRLY